MFYCLVILLGYGESNQNQEISHGSRTKDLVVLSKLAWFQMQEDRGERDRPDPGQHGNVHRVHPRGGLPVPHTGTLYSVQHELINYIDAKGKCRYLKKLTCKGTLRQVFICLRPDPLL